MIAWILATLDWIEHHIGLLTAVLAGAAIMQWRETRLTAERQLRAYVFNSAAYVVDGSTMGSRTASDRTGQVGVSISIKNFGQTPASKVIHWSDMQVSPTAREAQISAPTKLQMDSPFFLAQGAESAKPIWLNRSLSVQETEGILAGSFAIYCYGRIEYIDAFNRPRWSTYKLRYCGSAWPPIGQPAGMTFCEHGNDHN